MPNIVRQDIDELNASLTITIEPTDYQAKYRSQLKEYQKKAQIKGFRPGKTPASVIRKMYGKGILGEAVNEIFQKALSDYIKEEGDEIILQPMLEEGFQSPTLNTKSMEAYEYRFQLGLAPKFEIIGAREEDSYERYQVEEIDPELIEKDWEATRKRGGTREMVEENILENDIVRLKIKEIELEGASEVEETEGEEVEVSNEEESKEIEVEEVTEQAEETEEVEAEEIEALDEEEIEEHELENEFSILVDDVLTEEAKALLLGKNVGDQFQFEPLQLEKDLAEERVKRYFLGMEEDAEIELERPFHFEIVGITRTVPAEVTEDFLKQYFGEESTTEEAAKAVIEKNIKDYYEQQAESILFKEIQEKILDANQPELSEVFLKRWIKEGSERDLTEEEVEEQLKDFKQSVIWSIVSQRIKKANDIEVTEQEIVYNIRQQVYSYYGAYSGSQEILDQLVGSMLKNEDQVSSTYSNILTDKVIRAIKAQVQIEDKVVSSEEMDKVLEDLRAEQEKKQAEALAAQIKKVEAEKEPAADEAEGTATEENEESLPKEVEESTTD
ncbi:MAG: trigger factor [Bacteroidota bacterium]